MFLNKTQIEKIFKISFLSIGGVSFFFLMLFLGYHYYVNVFFGFQPTYDHPTFSDFSNNTFMVRTNHYFALYFIIVILIEIAVFPIALAVNIILKFTKKVQLNYKAILFDILGLPILWLLLYFTALGNTFTWMLD